MPGKIVAFPSGGTPGQSRKSGAKSAAPAGQVVEIVRLDSTPGDDEDALFDSAFRVAKPLLVPPDGAHGTAELVRQLLLGPPLLLAPFRKLHIDAYSPRSLPKWLYQPLALWQYANMAKGQIVYIRVVANDDTPPNRIQELLDARGMKQAELARLANVTVSALNKVVKGTRGLDQEWMRRLAPHLGVAPADLLPREDNPNALSDEERDLIERFRAADRNTRKQLDRVTAALLPVQAQESAA